MPTPTEPALSTYLHARGAKQGLPIGGTFELTARCNFNCPMCYVHRKENDAEALKQELSTQQWISLARQATDAGMVFALLTGGEPFVRKDFFEIYNAMKAMGLLVSINSNGSMLTGSIMEQLLANPPFRMNISLYGGCDETYQNMCGQRAYSAVVENIRALKEAGVDVRLNVSITPYNKQDVEKIFLASRELGVHAKTSSYMYPPIRLDGDCGHRLSATEAGDISALWDKLRYSPDDFNRRAESMCRFIRTEPRECDVDMEEGVSCRAGSSSFWLTWDGRMLPCGMMLEPMVRPLEIGFDEAWQQLRQATRQIRIPSECATCPKRQICSICAAVSVTETGAFNQVPRYVCEMTDATLAAMQRLRTDKE